MFKIIKMSEKSGFTFQIEFSREGQQNQVVNYTEESPQKRAGISCDMAFTFLKVRLDDLHRRLQVIKPHYFDTNQTPYMKNDLHWTESYWQYLGFRELQAELRNQPFLFANKVKELKEDLQNLIPTKEILDQEQIMQCVKDILETSEKLTKYISKYQRLTFTS